MLFGNPADRVASVCDAASPAIPAFRNRLSKRRGVRVVHRLAKAGSITLRASRVALDFARLNPPLEMRRWGKDPRTFADILVDPTGEKDRKDH